MADESVTTAPVDAQAPAAATEPAETTLLEGETTIAKEDEEIAGKQATTEVQAPDGEGTTEVADGPSAAATDATPASGRKEKRKSIGGVPEHKSKKLNKKKSMPTLHLECKPGEHYWARLKGFPPWPSIVCDEQMLPESLLGSRPVSTARPDGSIRDDFKQGGKNAKERTFPIMFLFTNEFSWMVNTALTPLDPEECKKASTAKMTKALKGAYQLASESHDLDFYKDVLKQWQEDEKAIAEERRQRQIEDEKAAELAAKKAAAEAEEEEEEDEAKDKKKKKARKSKGGDDDVEMEDAEAPKSSKKRKKDAESDGDGAMPKKTPKVTKLNAPKTPKDEASAKKSSSKPKKKVTAPKDDDEEHQKPQLTEEERLEQREKAILYLRHRLQKGFLSRDQAPQESEMAAMADFFTQLENYENLEPAIIRKTKIHKVLKAIVKLAAIPKDEEFHFKRRSSAMLEIWNKMMEADGETAPPSAMEPKSGGLEEKMEHAPATNGEKEADESKEDGEPAEEGAEAETEERAVEGADKIGEKVKSELQPKSNAVAEPPQAPAEKTEPGNDTKDDADADVSMQAAPEVAAEGS